MKKWYLTDLGVTLANCDDLQKDTFAKRLFRRPEIIAWLIKTCIPEFRKIKPSDIIDGWLSKADMRIGTDPVAQDVVRRSVPAIGTEDKSATDGTVFYDFRTELALPETSDNTGQLILDIEMQKDYKNWLVILKRVIYYLCRLISRQPGELMDGKEDYARLCKVCSIWILPAVPKRLANRVLHLRQAMEDMSTGHPQPISSMLNGLTDAWLICLNDKHPPKREQNGLWLMYVLLAKTISNAERMEILKTDFGIEITKELEDMYTYDDYRYSVSRMEGRKEGKREGLRKGRREGLRKGRREGLRKGRREGRDETILQAYTNMKKDNCKDTYICSMLGISLYKLRQIKKMACENTLLQNQLT